jgi:pimeloyl-ACP methyl ester carboxylesterase
MSTGTSTAADGTTIGWRTMGSGPGIVVVHGGATSSLEYEALARRLGDRYECCLMDRRGRGLSGPQGPTYGLEIEAADVAGVLARIGADILFGHSYGALVALQAALTAPLRALILYEPPLEAQPRAAELLPTFRAALARGDEVEAYVVLAVGLGVIGFSEEQFRWFVTAQLQPSPSWRGVVENLHAAERELEAAPSFRTEWPRYGALTTPTLVLTGSESPAYLGEPSQILAEVLPRGRLQVLNGQGHTATNDDPAAVAGAISEFLADLTTN